MDLSEVFQWVFLSVDVGGVVVAGVLGGMVARERRFDLVGFVALALMAALGGGMLRDVLLQSGPPVALTNPYYLGGAVLGAVVAFLLPLRGKWWHRFFILADAFVLGAWSATGTIKTVELGFGIGPAMLLGVITGVGGGMIRDIAVGRTPAIFGGNTLYATGALAATIPAMALWHAGHPNLALIAATLVGGIVCTAARWYKWRLPLNDDYSLGRTYRQVRASFEEYTRMREAGLLRRRRTEAVEIRARHSRRRRGRGLGRGGSR